jgi:NAD-dependent SIR2 family protein deacetylase
VEVADTRTPALVALLAGRRVAVLTGAGMSTDSGIPDYRGPDSPPSNPMTIRQFTSDPEFRQRYWARNHVGWRHMADTLPNLHGSYAQVICLACGYTTSRTALAEQLEALNPGFLQRAEAQGGLAVAPDADAVVADTASFRYVACPGCDGTLKPDIVYFGESVPKDRVSEAFSLVDGVLRIPVRPPCRRTGHPGRHRQSRAHPW